MKNFLEGFPPPEKLFKETRNLNIPEYREANSHIHTPYSFSAFPELKTAFDLAKDENIAVLGINDFYVTDGYEAFHDGCVKNGIFPLFNIEFIGLLKEEQKEGIRINDPNNPGHPNSSPLPFNVLRNQRTIATCSPVRPSTRSAIRSPMRSAAGFASIWRSA
jgi:hypothetical protein